MMETPFFRAIGISLLIPMLFCFPVEAREDSAQLVFQKTVNPDKTFVYVVKKGDSISTILRRQRGKQKARVPYDLIRRLNPEIGDLNRIYPGQKIVIPARETSKLPAAPGKSRKKNDPPPPTYKIKEKDTISRILLSELAVGPEDILPAYRSLRELNPDIDDLNRLPAGRTLKLPQKYAPQEHAPAADSFPPVARPAENAPAVTALKTPQTAEHILGIIRPVVDRMKGTLIAKGNYYIPLKGAGQITIDCSLIPAVELEPGATVFLDHGNRLPEEIKKLIGQSWENYRFVPGEELGDGLTALKGVINRSRNYEMHEAGSPLVLVSTPEIRVFPDWIITGKTTAAGASYRQGLFLLGSSESPLPGETRSFLEKNGLMVTEISGDRAVTGPAMSKATPAAADLRGLKGIALAESLLKILGETPLAHAEVVLFDRARNGFDLSMTADLLLRKGEKRLIIHAGRLPGQFVQILKEGGTEVIRIGEGASGRPLIEGLLRGLRIPVSFGHFSFRIPEAGDRPRLAATFSALRAIPGGAPLYLFDYVMSPDVLTFLNGLTGGRIATY